MGFLSRFEGKMEDTVEGAANKMAGAPISPVQIAKKAEKQMRREKMVGAGKQYAPTLYTVLVNPDDDERLFGYYPTLAGETETYLAAKAAEQGLVMDGQPLVRFIVDDDLKHGKFDVIAEAVAAPIVEQLRAEEMQRYGIAPAPAPRGGRGAYAAPRPAYGANAGRPRAAQPAFRTPQQAYAAPEPGFDAYGNDPYGASGYADAPQPAYDDPAQGYESEPPYRQGGVFEAEADGEDALFARPLPADAPAQRPERGNANAAFRAARAAAPGAGAPAAAMGAAAAAGAAAGAAAARPAAGPERVANTVVFAGAGQAAPAAGAYGAPQARACLINTADNREYTLGAPRLSLGRESKNDIVVSDINASRTHAELTRDGAGVWYLTDLGSTNGTLVNGYEIASQPLEEGDRITIGTTNFIFTYRG